jgi:hypothetical protein
LPSRAGERAAGGLDLAGQVLAHQVGAEGIANPDW